MKGIDVSKHNGVINFSLLKDQIDFVMIRAGYGKNNIDAKLQTNVTGAKQNSLHFGFYWFSYALTKEMAYKEADYLCDIADKYHPDFPLAYDWEYDSDKYATKQGRKLTNSDRILFAKTFLKRVEERGYYAMNYSNVDYIKTKGFNELLNDFDLWLAQWGTKEPSLNCGIWQYSTGGKLPGITGNVDMNISYKDYPQIIRGYTQETVDKSNKNEITEEEKQEIISVFYEKYKAIAEKAITGYYGNGEERKRLFEKQNIDYQIAQMFINLMVE